MQLIKTINNLIMSNLVINQLDYVRIKKCIKDAKQFKSITKTEAELLQKELDSAKIVKPEAIPSNVVTMNSIVKLSFLNNNKQVQFQIVYPDQANLKEHKISIFSPIATALIGYKVGDEIEWIVPAGLTNIRIDEIIYQPEAAGDYDL
jgi:regulator of nucleoside diphosphate kinase